MVIPHHTHIHRLLTALIYTGYIPHDTCTRYICPYIDPIHGDVRLSGSSTDPSRGVVEVYSSYYGWSTVCTDNWSDEEAVVVCRSMGYETGQKETIKYGELSDCMQWWGGRVTDTTPQ